MKTLSGFIISILILIYSNTENTASNFKKDLNKTLGKGSEIIKLEPNEIAVINVWATWCGPCIREIPELNEIVHEYKEKNVRFLAFSGENIKVYETFLQKRKSFQFDYELSFGNTNAISLLKSLDQSEYKGKAIPLHVLIDKNGDVADVFVGGSPTNIQKIKSFLEANASAE